MKSINITKVCKNLSIIKLSIIKKEEIKLSGSPSFEDLELLSSNSYSDIYSCLTYAGCRSSFIANVGYLKYFGLIGYALINKDRIIKEDNGYQAEVRFPHYVKSSSFIYKILLVNIPYKYRRFINDLSFRKVLINLDVQEYMAKHLSILSKNSKISSRQFINMIKENVITEKDIEIKIGAKYDNHNHIYERIRIPAVKCMIDNGFPEQMFAWYLKEPDWKKIIGGIHDKNKHVI